MKPADARVDFKMLDLGQGTERPPQTRLSTKLALEWAIFLVPLLVGSLIYLLFRPRTLRVFRLLDDLSLMPLVMKVRIAALPLFHALPKPIIYSLPNALWSFSLLYGVLAIWRDSLQMKAAWFWIAVTCFLIEGSEIGQAFNIVPGTFDWDDIVANSLGIVLSVFTACGVALL